MRGSPSVSVFAEQAANCPAGLSADRIVAPHARIVDDGRFFMRTAPPVTNANERLVSRRQGSTIAVMPSSASKTRGRPSTGLCPRLIDQGAHDAQSHLERCCARRK